MRSKFLLSLLLGLFLVGSTAHADSTVRFAQENVRRAQEVCGFELPEEETYRAEVVSVRNKLRVEQNEDFRVKAFIKNTGSMPWFSDESRCPGPRMLLGTDKVRDHASPFYSPELEGWVDNNRVRMDQLRVNPGEIASFTFWGHAGRWNDVHKEFYAPVLPGLEWIDDAGFNIDLIIGDPNDNASDLRKKLDYFNESGSASAIDPNGEKSVLVDRSDQTVQLKIGDYVVRQFYVSTGKSATPTPIGTTEVTLKQTVRIGHADPHYIMPKFMWFRSGGYGFHALPSLGSASLRSTIKGLQRRGEPVPTSLYEDDVLWTEALTHIGIPASHGCVRLLPHEADWMYDFVEIGTKVTVQQ